MMALSNILNEPVKELKEQVVGMAVVAFTVLPIWLLADWVQSFDRTMPFAVSVVCAFFMLFASLTGLVFCHWLGEVVLAKLAERRMTIAHRDAWCAVEQIKKERTLRDPLGGLNEAEIAAYSQEQLIAKRAGRPAQERMEFFEALRRTQ